MTAAVVPAPARPDWQAALLLYRDDGPLARALGRVLPARVPALVPLVAAGLPLLMLMATRGADASHGALGAALAFAILAGGLSRGGSHEGRLAWTVPPLLRAVEYGGILSVAAVAPAHAGGFALLGAIAFRHYDLVYRLRQRGEVPPAWVGAVGGGWEGRLIVAWLALAVGALPAAFFVLAALLAAVFVGESVAGWVDFARQGRRVSEDEDEEDEGQ